VGWIIRWAVSAHPGIPSVSIAASQQRTFLHLLAALRPHWRRDRALPARIQNLLTRDRAFGSRDRRLYRELIYTTLRHLPWIEPVLEADPAEAVRRLAWLAADQPATAAFRAAFATGSPPSGHPVELLPAWFQGHCPDAFTGAEPAALLRRAPLWLRLQTDARGAAGVFAEFASRGWTWDRSDVLPDAVRLHGEVDVTPTDAWRAGRIEVQDLGSQLILETIGVAPGGRWLDACAGAGGKTLQLARLLGRSGTVDATDIRAAALDELRTRAQRAIATTAAAAEEDRPAAIRILPPRPPEAAYDGVLVDAPCSGSGTWRRSPHLKWTTTDADIRSAAALQRTLLGDLSRHVRPGGRLVYATCSLSSRENEDVVAAFLAAHADFEPAPLARAFGAQPRGAGLLILPARHDTDGFFVASLRRR
jgi:16S rRNA (cytosine967-C5)-methyltransferase